MRAPAGFLLCAVIIALVAFPAVPARASEKRVVVGDVRVNEGETVEDVSTAWGDVVVEGEVEDGVRSAVGDVRIDGPIGGDVNAGSGDVYINAPVRGGVDVGNGDLYLKSGAQVGGPISVGNGTIFRDRESRVYAPQTAGMASNFREDPVPGAFSIGMIGWGAMALGLAAAAVLLSVAAPGPLKASARSLEASPGRSLVLGLGSAPTAVVLSVLLLLTGVGALLLFLLWPAYLALLLFGALVVAYSLGRRAVLAAGRYRAGDTLAAAVGALLLAATWLVPTLGRLLFAALALLGAGAVVSAFLARRRERSRGRSRASYTSY
jgi:hypothetical protein